MANLKRDTSEYTSFGLLLNRLCVEKGISFRQLAVRSGMSQYSHATILRACQGKSIPKRESILKWCEVLEASDEQCANLLRAFHYTAD